MPDYQITVDGLRGSSLLPFVEDLKQIAADNVELSDETLLHQLLTVPEEHRDEARTKLTSKVEEAPFYVSGARILMDRAKWGLTRTELDDVRELSRRHPEQIFFFMLISATDGRLVEYETLENFWRGRIQGGDLTAQYEASPIIWTEKAHF